jgi:hypothetical protein
VGICPRTILCRSITSAYFLGLGTLNLDRVYLDRLPLARYANELIGSIDCIIISKNQIDRIY